MRRYSESSVSSIHRENSQILGMSGMSWKGGTASRSLQSALSTNSSLTAGPRKFSFSTFLRPGPSGLLLCCCDKWSDHAMAIQSNPLNSESVNSGFCSSSLKYSHVRICSSSCSLVIDVVFPRGLSSGRRDKVKKPSAKDRRHSTENVSNPSKNISSIVQ